MNRKDPPSRYRFIITHLAEL